MPEDLSVNIQSFPRQEAVPSSASPVLASNGSLPPRSPTSSPLLYITDELLFNFHRCNRRAFLDLYGDQTLRDPPSDYLLKLRHDSQTYQSTVLGQQTFHRPDYPIRDWSAGVRATFDLMHSGAERISRGVLLLRRDDGVVLISCPDLLVKQPGRSRFGEWQYMPMDIKLGKRPKLEYQITAAFHAYVLSGVQDASPEESWLILRHRLPYRVDLVDVLPRMESILGNCIQTLRDQQEPEVFIAHSRCELCHWYSHCYDLAQAQQHLSLLPGVTPNRYVHLQDLNLTTLESIATVPPRQLETLPGFGPDVAHRLVLQAQATLHQKPVPRPLWHDSTALLSPEELPTAPVELYFDIEAAPEHNLVYLHGVLVVDRPAHTSTFHPLLATRPEDELVIWEQLLDLIWQYPEAPIFHFCPYEVQTVKRLGEQYGTPWERIEPLMGRFVDLHERVTRVAILPVERYALKQIARWIGFNWRDVEANGAQSIYWYDQWLRTGDRTYLDAILRYNEDDCRATYLVKDWLVEFNQQCLP